MRDTNTVRQTMNNTTHDVTDEDKTAALCAATDYCREAVSAVPGPMLPDRIKDEVDALERIHDEALGGWFEGREVALEDSDLERAQKALWTWREKSLDDGDFDQALQAEMALRDLKDDYPEADER